MASELYHSGTIGKDNIIRGEKTLDIPVEDLFSFFKKKVESRQDEVALIEAISGSQMTYEQLLSNSRKLAAFFEGRGYKEGDCIAIHTPNSTNYQIVILGTLAKGMVFTTANPAYTSHEINHQLISTNARVLFTNSALVDTAKKAIENTKVDLLVLVDEKSTSDSGVVRLSDILQNGDGCFEKELTVDPINDVACILFTSGTTGLPKGVMLTHHNLVCNIIQMDDAHQASCKNTLCVLPMFHVYGVLFINIMHMWRGATVISLPCFNPITFLTAIQDYKIESIAIVPPILKFLLNHPVVNNFDLSSVKVVVLAAAPADEKVTAMFTKKFPCTPLLQGFGTTEGLSTHGQPFNAPTACKQGSCGYIVRNADWKVICLVTGEALGANTQGEICTKGPQVMKGYLNNEATAECINNGWLRTGDLGYYDEDGCMFVVDRLKDLIKYKGFQVAPAELEGMLLSHPNIVDSCVIGIPDERAGQLPRAYVVVKDKDSTITEDDIHSFMSEKLADIKRLRGGIKFVDAIPKSAAGKMLRKNLLQEYLDAQVNN